MSTENAQARRTQQERKQEAEEALLDAAAELVVEQGIVQTSLAQIGERAGYSRGLVNHHFGTKDALIERLVKRSRRQFLERVNPSPDDSGLESIIKSADAYIRIFLSKRSRPALVVMWGAALPESAAHESAIAESDEGARLMIVNGVRRGQKDGSISKDVDPDAYAVAHFGMLRGIAGQLMIKPNKIKGRELREEIRRLIEASLKP